MISVLIWCHDRQSHLDQTLPLWLKQTGVDYEICVCHGKNVKVPEHWEHPQVRTCYSSAVKMGRAYNSLLAMAKGDILLITQADFKVHDPTQLRRMLEAYRPDQMVSERFFKDGLRQAGIYLQFLMVSKEAVEKAGGWYEGFDCPATAAHEDSDLMARLLESGMDLKLMETPAECGVYHIDHLVPDYVYDPIVIERLKNGHAVYKSRHDKTVLSLYVKQFARNMMEKARQSHV